MKSAGWAGYINVLYLATGKRQRVKNSILDAGLGLTSELWLGLTSEVFSTLQIEDGVGGTLAKALSGSYAIAGNETTVTSTASFTSGEVSFDVVTVALIGSLGTRIAEATVDIPSGNAVEITREDLLSEVV